MHPGKWREATNRFLDQRTERRPPVKGIQTVGDWISVDGGRGWGVVESQSAEAVYESNALWSDVLDIYVVPVVSHDEAEPILKRVYKK